MNKTRPTLLTVFVVKDFGKAKQYDIMYFLFARIVLKRKITTNGFDHESYDSCCWSRDAS